MALVETLPRDDAAVAAVTAILKQKLGDRLQTGQAIRDQHGSTTTWLPVQAPDAVAFPDSTSEVA
jgi:D-lactate dehydrogenase (cytochrome)